MSIFSYLFGYNVTLESGAVMNTTWIGTGIFLFIAIVFPLGFLLMYKSFWGFIASLISDIISLIAAYLAKMYIAPIVLNNTESDILGMFIHFLVVIAPFIILLVGVFCGPWVLDIWQRNRGYLKPLDMLWCVLISCVAMAAIVAILCLAHFLLSALVGIILLIILVPLILGGIKKGGDGFGS